VVEKAALGLTSAEALTSVANQRSSKTACILGQLWPTSSWPPRSEPLISRCCEARPDRRSGQDLEKDPWRGGFGSQLTTNFSRSSLNRSGVPVIAAPWLPREYTPRPARNDGDHFVDQAPVRLSGSAVLMSNARRG